MIHTFGLGKGVLGGGGLQTPDFQKKSGVPPDSRLQISRKNLEYPQTPDSRFPEKIWSTGTPDSSQKKSGVPGPRTPDSRAPGFQISRKNLESGVEYPGPQTPDSRFPEKIFLEYSKKSGVPGGLESGAPVLQIFSGNLESGVRGPGTPDFFWKSGVRGPDTPDFSGD